MNSVWSWTGFRAASHSHVTVRLNVCISFNLVHFQIMACERKPVTPLLQLYLFSRVTVSFLWTTAVQIRKWMLSTPTPYFLEQLVQRCLTSVLRLPVSHNNWLKGLQDLFIQAHRESGWFPLPDKQGSLKMEFSWLLCIFCFCKQGYQHQITVQY